VHDGATPWVEHEPTGATGRGSPVVVGTWPFARS